MKLAPRNRMLAGMALVLLLAFSPGCGDGGDEGTGQSDAPVTAQESAQCIPDGESCVLDGNFGRDCCSGSCDYVGDGRCKGPFMGLELIELPGNL